MSEDDSHRLCRVEKDVAVLQEQNKGAAMALVLSRDLVEAHRRSSMYLVVAAIGWIVAIFLSLRK